MRPLVVIGITAALYAGAGVVLPFSATHRLSVACGWLPAPSLDPLGLNEAIPSAADNDKRAACLHRKGAKADPLSVNRFLKHWPSKRQFAKWEASYDRPLDAEEAAGNVQARDSR